MESFGMTLIDQLILQDVTQFCLAPGFRSSPLAVAVAKHPGAEVFVHYDERALGFYALGMAKASQRPVAVIVTSGTAVGNLMPAVMEADAAGVPLVLLTADRPVELRDTMANQTCDQLKLFGSYVRFFFDLPTPGEALPANFLGTTVAQAVARASFPHPGPVHLNCPFREPFFGQEPGAGTRCQATNYSLPKWVLDDPKGWADELKRYSKGVIVLGSRAPDATVLAEKLGWPILADILSGYREKGSGSIAHYHHIVKSVEELKADCILHLGDAVVSKPLIAFMAKAERLIHVAAHSRRCDPNHRVTDRIICDPIRFCQAMAAETINEEPTWLPLWKDLSKRAEEALSLPADSEPAVFDWITKRKTALFFGNSMPIRDADMFFFPKRGCGPIFANRGLSGIDGNIATIAGIAQHGPVTAVIGDQTALHDLGSLALLKKTKYPAQIVLINNGGGGIFSFVALEKKKDLLDPYFAAAHDRTFRGAANMFGLTYSNSLDEEADLIELFTNREENQFIHQEIDRTLSEALCSSFSTAS